MKKKTVIILTIVSSIISMIIILLSYFGINRYLWILWRDSNVYITKYSSLPKEDTKNKVVISLSATEDNIGKIKPMINSILDQTVKVDQIILVLPNDFTEKGHNVPNYLNKVVTIVPSGRDYDKGTKIIPVLLREKECDTIIIALDNNIVYGQDFIYSMLEESKNNPNKVLVDNKGYSILAKPDNFGCDVLDRNKDKIDNTWFLEKAKDNMIVEYSENYPIIFF